MSFFKKINLSLGKKKDDEYEDEFPEGEEGEEVADDQEEEEEEPEEEEPEVDEEKEEAMKAKAKVTMVVSSNIVVGEGSRNENEERRGNERVLVIVV